MKLDKQNNKSTSRKTLISFLVVQISFKFGLRDCLQTMFIICPCYWKMTSFGNFPLIIQTRNKIKDLSKLSGIELDNKLKRMFGLIALFTDFPIFLENCRFQGNFSNV